MSKVRKGTYALIVELKEEEEIEVGRLGVLSFKRGYYAYIGSAMGGLDGRIGRHLRKDKNKHWHIDYLLEKGAVRTVFLWKGKERNVLLHLIWKMSLAELPILAQVIVNATPISFIRKRGRPDK